jgi:hypothetical protein
MVPVVIQLELEGFGACVRSKSWQMGGLRCTRKDILYKNRDSLFSIIYSEDLPQTSEC